MKYMKVVNFQYDFTMMYYLHDVNFQLSNLAPEKSLQKHENTQHHT